MGKSTINHHFQQLFVCLPKGRLGGSATASRGAREGTHDATQHVLRHHTGPQVEPDQCRDGGGKDEWKWVAFLRIHKWLVTFGEKKKNMKKNASYRSDVFDPNWPLTPYGIVACLLRVL